MFTTRGKVISRQLSWMLLAVITMLSACKKDKDKSDPGNNPGNTPPEIVSFTPSHGAPGTIVTIQGKNFKPDAALNKVSFTGSALNAEITGATATELKVKVPADAITGKITVKTGNTSVTSTSNFTVDPESVSITDFTPKQGPFGTTVTITGKKFAFASKVKINGIEATISQQSSTQIVFTIPVNTTLTAHKITVISDNDILETTDLFTVTAAGPYARWESKNISFLPDGANAFQFGLSFVYKNKIYWGFTRMFFNSTGTDYVVYDPAQSTQGWVLQNQPPADMAPENIQDIRAVVHNNRVFMGTGLIGSTRSNQWWEFHPETNTSTRLTDFPEAVKGAITFTMNNKIYAGFGSSNQKLYEFDPSGNSNSGSWNLKATGALRELNTGNAIVLGNEVFLGRALPDLQQTRNAIYKFTEAGGVTRISDMPDIQPSLTTPSFTIGNKGYFVIGKNVWEFTPDATGGTWRAVLSDPNAPTIVQAAVLTINGTAVVYGWTSSGRLYEFKFN